MDYNADNLLTKPSSNGDVICSITPGTAGWKDISFQARRLATGATWQFYTDENEFAFANLTGTYDISTDKGNWHGVGSRRDVFSGCAHVVVIPRRTKLRVTAQVGGEFVTTWAPTDRDIQPLFIEPHNVRRFVRGGDNVSRQVNDLLPPGSPVHRLVLVEVYTPSGNWSGYPPHKHDVHVVTPNGTVLEADLEEVYFYKLDKPHGFALQRIYTDARSPEHRAGHPIDATLRCENDCTVIVPAGYHPVVSAPGYCTYFFNVLAGSAQSLANTEDPRYAWVRDTYQNTDPRLPLY